jgi:DNA-binding XRE family transcriptional regulator
MAKTISIVAKNIKLMRDYLGLKQDEFADKFSTNRSSVMSYEQGRAKPKAELSSALCDYFGITMDQLFKEPLEENQLKPGTAQNTPSITQVKYESALREVELLKQQIADKDYIIELQKRLLK